MPATRPIRENVAKVAVAVLGANLGLERPRETRPSRPTVELVEGCEEWLAGNHIDVCPGIRWRRDVWFPSVCVTRYCSGVNFETASGFFL
jgi:hypothetical protein